jgi:hypothetical protein
VLVMTQRRNQMIFQLTFALVALFALAIVTSGCSAQRNSRRQVGTADNYLAQGRSDAYAYYGSDDLCTSYDPFCLAPFWYPAPAHFYSRDDGDNDCDDGNCHHIRGHQRRPVPSRTDRNRLAIATSSTTLGAAPSRFDGRAPATSLAHFAGTFGHASSGGGHAR